MGQRVMTIEQCPVGIGSKMPAWFPPAVMPTMSQWQRTKPLFISRYAESMYISSGSRVIALQNYVIMIIDKLEFIIMSINFV